MINELGGFKFEKISKFNKSIYSLKVSNRNVIAVTKNILLRFTIDNPLNIEEIRISNEDDCAQNIFLDPTGNHALICMQGGLTFYLHKSNKNCRLIKESKGLLIESVGWNIKHGSEHSTGYILLGTSTGDLIETKLNSSTIIVDKYWEVILNLEQCITGIVFDSYPNSNNLKYFIVITTSTNIYPRFMDFTNANKGNFLFAAEFEKINQTPVGFKCTTFPMEYGYSHLDLFYPKNATFPCYLAWMNGAGVYFSMFHEKTTDAEINLFSGPRLLNQFKETKGSVPITVAASQFHVMLQYSDIISFVCTVNDQTVFTLPINKLVQETCRGLCKDQVTGLTYMFTDTHLFLINSEDETKTLWRTFLNQKNYSLAYQHCNNDEEKNSIRIREADCLFKEQKYCEAAVLYANTDKLFEETVSLFIDFEKKDPLKKYLLTIITNKNVTNKNPSNTHDITCLWLLELFFEEIINENFKTGRDMTNELLKSLDPDYKTYTECPAVVASLKKNKKLIYDKIKIYGDSTQLAIFAEIIQDRETIIKSLLERGNLVEAMKMLCVQTSPSVHYKYGAVLINSLPEEVIDMWIKGKQKLDPKKVLPIIRNLPDAIAKKYVKHVILNMNCDYEEIHNFYILICARLESLKTAVAETQDLISYLEDQGSSLHGLKYDPTLALRICLEYENTEGSVFLYCLLNKNKEAVELALKEKKVQLAKKVVSRFYGSEDVKKHLWLQIARFIISEQKDIHEACLLVKKEHVLKLEDILPYFPDYVKIEEFSEAICDSLDYYESHMANLKADMKISTEYAEKNREEINLLKHQPIVIPDNAVCAYCLDLLTARAFCAFSCDHYFHMHCLEKVVEPLLGVDKRTRYYELKEKLAPTTYEDVELKRELHSLLTSDCCYCGMLAVDNVNVPLLTFGEFDSEMSLWI